MEKSINVYSRKERDELSRKLISEGWDFLDWNYEVDIYINSEGEN